MADFVAVIKAHGGEAIREAHFSDRDKAERFARRASAWITAAYRGTRLSIRQGTRVEVARVIVVRRYYGDDGVGIGGTIVSSYSDGDCMEWRHI